MTVSGLSGVSTLSREKLRRVLFSGNDIEPGGLCQPAILGHYLRVAKPKSNVDIEFAKASHHYQ